VSQPADARDAPKKALGAATPRKRLPRRLKVQLTFVVPLAAGYVVLLSVFVLLWVCYPLLFEGVRVRTVQGMERRVTWVFTVGGALSLVGLAVAIVVAEWLARPLRSLMSQMESARRVTGDSADHPESDDLERGALEDAVSSITKLVRDSYTLRSMEGGVMTLDQSGGVTSFSQVAERVLGCAASAAIGRPLRQVLPDDAANAAFLRSVSEALAGAGLASSAEAEVRARDGRLVRLGYTLSPLRNEAGTQVGLVVTFKDLAPLKAAEKAMRRTENLAVLGAMAFRLAHEIGNPLAAMSGLVQLIRDEAPPGAPTREHCRMMLESIDRLTRICKDLLALGRPDPRKVGPVDVNELVRSTVALCRHDPANKSIVVRETYAPDVPAMQGDRERLAEVVLNILRNAYQAVRQGGGEIAVATSVRGSTVAIAISNTGPPIPPEVQEKLFTPFFTTHARGTGLGLALSQQLVRAHGGEIRVESGVGKATTFTIELPVAGPDAGDAGP